MYDTADILSLVQYMALRLTTAVETLQSNGEVDNWFGQLEKEMVSLTSHIFCCLTFPGCYISGHISILATLWKEHPSHSNSRHNSHGSSFSLQSEKSKGPKSVARTYEHQFGEHTVMAKAEATRGYL
jgi:hypothetical protein